MAVKIKLQRIGKIRTPHYRVVIADARTRRSGRVIENIGTYEPKSEPSVIKIDSDRAQHWLSVGAQPTEPVLALLKVTGDWQKFKGEGDSAGSLKTAEEKKSAEDLIAEADKAAAESREGAKKSKDAENSESEEGDVSDEKNEAEEAAPEVEPGSEEGDAKGESTEDAEAQTTDEA